MAKLRSTTFFLIILYVITLSSVFANTLTPPVITSVSIPSVVNNSDGSSTVTYTVSGTSITALSSKVCGNISSPNGQTASTPTVRQDIHTISPSGHWSFECSGTIPAIFPSGKYVVNNIEVVDANSTPSATGYSSEFSVTHSTAPAAPLITSISPVTVTGQANSGTLKLSFTMKGTSGASILSATGQAAQNICGGFEAFESNSGQAIQFTTNITFTASVDFPDVHNWEATCAIQVQSVMPPIYSPISVNIETRVVDSNGMISNEVPTPYFTLGPPPTLTPPAITYVSNPVVVNKSDGSSLVTFTVGGTSIANLLPNQVNCGFFGSLIGNNGVSLTAGPITQPVAATHHWSFVCSATLPAFLPSGQYATGDIQVTDVNTTESDPSYSPLVTITHPSAPAAPVITSMGPVALTGKPSNGTLVITFPMTGTSGTTIPSATGQQAQDICGDIQGYNTAYGQPQTLTMNATFTAAEVFPNVHSWEGTCIIKVLMASPQITVPTSVTVGARVVDSNGIRSNATVSPAFNIIP